MKLDISKLNKVELLQKLCENQKAAGFFAMSGRPVPTFNTEQAKKAVTQYIDYFSGKAIKTDLSKDTVDTFLYDRDAGEDTFQKIVESMK